MPIKQRVTKDCGLHISPASGFAGGKRRASKSVVTVTDFLESDAPGAFECHCSRYWYRTSLCTAPFSTLIPSTIEEQFMNRPTTLREAIERRDAILIGAGAGLSVPPTAQSPGPVFDECCRLLRRARHADAYRRLIPFPPGGALGRFESRMISCCATSPGRGRWRETAGTQSGRDYGHHYERRSPFPEFWLRQGALVLAIGMITDAGSPPRRRVRQRVGARSGDQSGGHAYPSSGVDSACPQVR